VARSDHDVRVDPSVLDRLIDDDPKASHDAFVSPRQSEDRYRQSVMRDLEVLLNTRDPFFDLSADFVEVKNSGLCYGLPDFTNLKVGNPGDQQRLRQLVETALRRFEPRLKQVAVTVSTARDADRSVHLRIDATLDISPAPEPVSFDIALPVSSRRYQVTEIV
jgi:type VI secretion system protein ImpF